jgi:hypothetical protein
MLVREITSDLCIRIDVKHINPMYGQNAGFRNVAACVTLTFCEVCGFSIAAHICQHDLLLLMALQPADFINNRL